MALKHTRKRLPTTPGRKPYAAPKGYMTTTEVAEMLNVSPDTVRSWIKSGEVKPDKTITEKIGQKGQTRVAAFLFRTSRIEIIRQKRAKAHR